MIKLTKFRGSNLLFVLLLMVGLAQNEAVITLAQYQVYLPIIFKSPYNPQKGLLLARSEFCEDLDTLNVGWYFNNQITPPSSCPAVDQRFVPRLYGADQVNDANVLAAAIQNARPAGWLLGFTEPNLPWHANLTPLEGAIAWHTIVQAAAPYNIKLVAPAPSQHELGYFDQYGYTWIWEMIDAYHGQYGVYPKIDAFAWNYYHQNPIEFDIFFSSRRSEADTKFNGHYANTPFWVLEYAGACWNSVNGFPTGNVNIMTTITPAFKNKIYNITRFAWFTHRIRPDEEWGINHHSCSLLDPATGSLLTLGNLYRQYEP